ncbi:NAD-dependent epimerase/dehydratase family protein [Staphylospora marina]|uniref:NAD-dependent epimerase/dehydratase family protein n=1 Tax=Staphylospora marina TaxID=2490858 RepID=UPI000F5C26CD|nr:NAD-dependent epimerase/dehydratase family protein [Staphylospora marina]
MGKTALVLGATGLVGKELTRLLLEDDRISRVVSVHRRTTGIVHPKLEERIMNLDHMEKAVDLFSADDIYCCLGTTIKKAGTRTAFGKVDLEYPLAAARLAKQSGAGKFLVISSMGANPNSPFFYSRIKGKLEEELMKTGLPALFIFRPSLLLGKRNERRVAEDFAASVYRKFPGVFAGKFLAPYRPVPAEAVARAMIHMAMTDCRGVHIVSSSEILDAFS